MKKLIALMLAFGVTAGIAHAQTQVLSQNAVGYVKQEIEEGKLYLVTNPFLNLDSPSGEHLLVEMLDAVPNNTIVSIWDNAAQTYINYARGARGAWLGDAPTATLEPGEAFFLRIPEGTGSADLFLMGEVPSDDEVNQGRVPGLTFLGFPYPAQVMFTNTSMAINVPNNTIVSIWDAVNSTYINYAKGARGAWLGDAPTAVIQPGQAFIVRSSEAGNDWDEVKPYTWP